jgi:histidinol dehydrogenase
MLGALREGGGPALAALEGGLRGRPDLPVAEALRAAPAEPLEVAVDGAAERIDPELLRALREARGRLRAFLAPGMPRPYTHVTEGGARVSSSVVPLRRAGIYVPGGRAPYPSSVLMAAVAARVAGVEEVVLCTPDPAPAVLAAAEVAGVGRAFVLGPVQAAAAMAWGLPPVPRCDRVVGPGGAWLVEAKRQLCGEVGLDALPGPSEIVVLASAGSDPAWVAADLLAQAEHGPDGLCLLLAWEAGVAAQVAAELERQAGALPSPRREDALEALARSAGPVLCASAAEALALAEEIAPEHLSLQGAEAEALAGAVGRAGTLCVGPWAPVAGADYGAAGNHILPTGGAARWASALSPADFVRRMQVWEGTAAAAGAWAPAAEALAAAEGFAAHGRSVALRRAQAVPAAAAAAPAPYVPPVPPGALRLDLNENPFPWPEALWAEVQGALHLAEPSRYPRETERLQAALAAQAGVPADWCLPANGSDELLLAAVAAWGRGAVRAVFPVPTFGMYRRLAEAAGLPAVAVPLGPAPGFALPVEALRRELGRGGDSLLFLCRPNNPTGTLWPEEDVRALVETEGTWAVLDEAYVEFAGGGLGDWLAEHPRLCILRTMSKAFAFAGLRVGYALGCPEALAPLRQAVQPWAVTAWSTAAALAVLRRGAEVHETVGRLVAERERLAAGLGGLPGIRPHPSWANFILFAVDGCDAFAVWERLYREGAVVRRFPGDAALRGCLRVSVGRPEENDAFLAALAEALRAERGGA